MSIHMTAMETAPKRLVQSFEEMQTTARWYVTDVYDGITPSPASLLALKNLADANIAELLELEATFDKYPWQGSLKIRHEAYLDTMRQLENAMNRSISYGNH